MVEKTTPRISSKQQPSANSASEPPARPAASRPAHDLATQCGSSGRAERCSSEPRGHRARRESRRFSTARRRGLHKVTNPKPTRPHVPHGLPWYLRKATRAGAGKCLDVLRPWVKDERPGQRSTFSWSERSEADTQTLVRPRVPPPPWRRNPPSNATRPPSFSLPERFPLTVLGGLHTHIKPPLGSTARRHLQLVLCS